MPDPIHQHTIPKFYLRKFVHPNHNPKLWKYDLERGDVVLKSPSVLSIIDDFYTINDESGPNRRVEDMLQRLESLYAPTVENLATFTNISPDDLQEIGFFAATMFVRTKKRRDIVNNVPDATKRDHLIKTLAEFDQLSDDEKAEVGLTREELLESLQNHEFKGSDVVDMLDALVYVFEGLTKMPLEIFVAPPGDFFITSDNPVSLISTDPTRGVPRFDAADKSILVTFPIGPTVCLVWGGKSIGNACITTARNVRTLNIRTINAAGSELYSGLRSSWLDKAHRVTHKERNIMNQRNRS